MTGPHAPPRPLQKQSSWSPDMLRDETWQPRKAPLPPRPLQKQNSWSPDTLRDETWERRKSNFGSGHHNRSKSVSEEDLEELKACFELGFGFDSPVIDPKLSDTLPALQLYYAVNNRRSESLLTEGGDAEEVKTRLRQWAQLVACSVRQSSSAI